MYYVAPGQDTTCHELQGDVYTSDADFKQLLSINTSIPRPTENMLGITGLALISCVTLKGLTKGMPS